MARRKRGKTYLIFLLITIIMALAISLLANFLGNTRYHPRYYYPHDLERENYLNREADKEGP